MFAKVKIVVKVKKHKKLNLWTSFCISWYYNNSLPHMPSSPGILYTPTLLIFDNPF